MRRQELLHHAATSPDSSSPSHSPFSAGTAFPSSVSAPGSIKTEPIDDDQTTGRLLQDSDGTARFLGETSGATFLDHLKELIGAVLPLSHQQQPTPYDGSAWLSTLGRYYTDDSRQSNERNVNPLLLPPDTTMQSLLSEVRYVVQDGNDEWPSGGIFYFGDLSTVPRLPMSMKGEELDSDQYRYLSLYHAAFAVSAYSTVPWPNALSQYDNSYSESFFARASALLRNPLDIGRCSMQDVAALALMAFYLIEVSKRDSAYMHVAAAAHISIMLGAHRGMVDDRGKRVFWTVYILDRWLSCLMGRPPIISDDAVRIPAPSDAPGLPPAAGLRAHVELSRISGYVVCNTYRIAPSESSASAETAHSPGRVMWMLEQWKSTLPAHLQLTRDGLHNDPACCMLHMRHNQLVIVATRPLFFVAVKKSMAERLAQSKATDSATQLEPLKACVESARSNMRLARHFLTINRHSRPLHALLHYCFTAACCLILQDLVQPLKMSDDSTERSQDIQFAISVLENQEACLNNPDSKSCTSCLHDLRLLVARLTSPAQPEPTFQSNTAQLQAMGLTEEFMPQPMHIETQPALYNELVTWMDDEWLMYNTYME